ncbi:hypothetical protein [Changpingibacter yushuensis]|uniref:hypothetical protein n=1 Tax=Changpingibacter yushuensis TaxID=2758440 RepID=UPI0015F43E5B|nr:hypothetical protein [Changpingibacter yushuensis]
MSEIEVLQVAQWAPLAAEHMADIRINAGLLNAKSRAAFVSKQLDQFRVGLPRESKVLVDEECSQWLWLREGNPLRLVAGRTAGDAADWIEALRIHAGDREIVTRVCAGDSSLSFLNKLASRDLEVRLWASFPEDRTPLIGRVPVVRLRGMFMNEVSTFLARVRAADDAMWISDPLEISEQHDRVTGIHPESTLAMVADSPTPAIEDCMSMPGHELLSICVDGVVIGGIWYEVDCNDAKIWRICIFRGSRGRGYLRGTVVALLERLRGERMRSVEMILGGCDAKVRGICLSEGFREVERLVAFDVRGLGSSTKALLTARG